MIQGILRNVTIFLLSLLLLPTLALAQQSPAGVVTSLYGTATVAHGATPPEMPLKFKDDVFHRDRLATKESSIVRVLLGGKALVTVRELSLLTITEQPGRATVEIHSGKIALAVARKLMRPGEFIEIRTPNAVASVRGTVVIIEVIQAALGAVATTVVNVLSGFATVSLPTAPTVPPVTVSAGQSLPVTSTGFGQIGSVSPTATQGLTPPSSPPTGSPASGQISANQTAQATAIALALTPPTPTPPPPAVSTPPPSTSSVGVNATTTTQAIPPPPPPPPPPGPAALFLVDHTNLQLSSGVSLGTFTGGTPLSPDPGAIICSTPPCPLITLTTPGVSARGATLSVSGSNGGPVVEIRNSTVMSSLAPLLDVRGTTLTTGPLLKVGSTLQTPAATSLLANGDFETGNFSGWTKFNQLGGSGDFFIQTGTLSPISGFGVPAPPQGTFAAMSDQFGPGVHILHQDVTVPVDSPVLRFSLFVGNRSTSFASPNTITLPNFSVAASGSPASNQQVRVDLMSPSANIQDVGAGVLRNLFQTMLGDRLVSGYHDFVFDLSDFAGQTVRLRFTEVDNQFFFQLGVDGVRVGSEPALLRLTGGASLTVGGPIFDFVNSDVTVSGPLARISGGSTLRTTAGPAIRVSGGSLTADALVTVGSDGNTIDLTGTAVEFAGTTVTLRRVAEDPHNSTANTLRLSLGLNEPLFKVSNSTVTLTGVGRSFIGLGETSPTPIPTQTGVFLKATASAINLKGNLLELEGITTTDLNPLLQVSGTTVTQTVTTDSLISVDPDGGPVTMAGPLAAISGSTIKTSGPVFHFQDGTLTSNSTQPFISINPSTVESSRQFALLNNGLGLTLKGSFLEATDTVFSTTSDQFSFFAMADGASVTTSGTAAPLLKFKGTGPGLSKVTAARNFLPMAKTTAGSPVSSMNLSGPLLEATKTDFETGNPSSSTTGNTFTFLFVGDSAELKSTSTLPLMSFDGSSVDTAGNILTLRRSTSAAAPSRLILSGPLFSATNGSSFNTTSLGFGSAFGTSGAACCSGFSIEQGAQLSSSTTLPLIQLNNSTFVGSDSQSGGNFFRVADTFTGAPSGELVAPASVNLTGATGSLLSATGGSIRALFSLLSVQRSSLTSSGTGPLIHLGGGATVTLGGTNPIDGSAALGDVLFLQSSPTPDTAASPASVSLAAGQILLSGNNATLTLTKDVVGVFNGATFSSSTISGLISLINTSLTAGTPSINGRMLNVAGLGGPSGTGFATASLKKLLVSDSESTLALTGGLAGIFAGGQVTTNNSTDPFVLITGGSHSIATNGGTALFQLQGRSTNTFVETDPDAAGLVLGADQPLVHGNELLQTSGGTSIGSTTPSQSGLKIDPALLAATAPLFDLTSSTLTSAIDFVNLVNKAKLSANIPSDSLIKLNASTLTINNGSLVNVTNGSFANITGNLFKVDNTSTINITGGWLVSVSGGSVFKLTGGSLGVFGSTGTNTLNITNNTALCGGCHVVTDITNLAGTKVFLGNGVSPTQVQVTSGFAPFANLTGSNSVNVSGASGAVLAVKDPASKIVLKP